MIPLQNYNAERIAKFKNFKLTFHMQSPIMLGHPWIALDGILAHLINREIRGQNFWTLPSKEPIPNVLGRQQNLMPLKKTVCYPHGDVYHGSVAWLDCADASATTIYKRFDESRCHMIQTQKQKIDVGRGLFRAYMMRLPYIPAKTACFYACGDLMEVLRLLSYLPGLGKKVAYGYGMIKGVSVEETDEDYSLVKDGVAMRPLPDFLADSDEKMMLAYRPPYWDKRNVVPCVPPGAHVKS